MTSLINYICTNRSLNRYVYNYQLALIFAHIFCLFILKHCTLFQTISKISYTTQRIFTRGQGPNYGSLSFELFLGFNFFLIATFEEKFGNIFACVSSYEHCFDWLIFW